MSNLLSLSKQRHTLSQGVHILSLPLNQPLPIGQLFPRSISGSSIEMTNDEGGFKNKQSILYEHGQLHVHNDYQILYPLQVIRLTLCREIILDWDIRIRFQPHNALSSKEVLPYTEGFDKEKALYLIQLCSLIYNEEPSVYQILQQHYDFNSHYFFSKKSRHKTVINEHYLNLLYLFFKSQQTIINLQFMKLIKFDPSVNKHIIILVFKGTDKVEDWATNLSSMETRFIGEASANVHKGFQDAVKLFLRTVKKNDFKLDDQWYRLEEKIFADLNANTKIILTGHSLGGAIATLAACYFYDKGVAAENLEVYTFGAPPIGTEDFVTHYDQKFPFYRLVNEFDIIPKLDSISALHHLGEAIELPSNNAEVHSCDDYIDNLLDALETDSKAS